MNYLVPGDDDFVEIVAKAIAKNRLHRDTSQVVEEVAGVPFEEIERLETAFDAIFERLWAGDTEHDETQKSQYRSDARAAIAAINLKLLVSE